MQKLAAICFCIISLHLHVAAQNLPAFRQFYFNPFIFNPAFTGLDGYTEISVTHRQQWLNVTDAPVASGLNIQYPTHSRVSLGFNLLSQEAVALRNTSAKAIFAYRIPISANQMFSFGISVGAGYNSLDLDDIDYSNDPAILGATDNRVYADGNFGAVYSLHGLKVGFALPRLFGQPYVSPQSLQGNGFSQLKNQLYSISYRFNTFQGNVSFEPYFFYRLNRDNQNSWESSLSIYFKEKIWTGASYHNTQGTAFFLGMLIKERFRLGYSYELPPTNKEFISTSSHELHLGFRLGKKKTGKSTAEEKADHGLTTGTEPATETNNIPLEPPPVPKYEKEQIAPPFAVDKTTPSDSSTGRSNDELALGPPKTLVLLPGYYIIVGSYRNFENASNLQLSLKSKGHAEVYTGLYGKKGVYYVYSFSTYSLSEAKEKVKIYASIEDFKGAWILKID